MASFLSETQRSQLDAALALKEKEQAAARAHHNKVAAGERKNRQGKGTGGPKKAGGGGKFTWGNMFTNGDTAERVLDRNDPNYDSDEERAAIVESQQSRLKKEVKAYKQEVLTIVEEYFESGDVNEVAESLEDLGAPELFHYFVKRLVTVAMDRRGREREMTSLLLSTLYAEVIIPDQVQKGFHALVDGLPDLVLDVPDAAELLSLFIARAVVDDVLPPSFISKIPSQPEVMGELRHKAEALITGRHNSEKILRCWGAGAGRTHQDTKDSISRLLDEYCTSLDVEEAARCLHALGVPFFHHELVKQALQRAMAATGQPLAQSLVLLLGRLTSTGEVSAVQTQKGFQRVAASLEDLELDAPGAKEQWAAVIKLCRTVPGLVDEATLGGAASPSPSTASSVVNGGQGGYAHSVSAFKAAAVAAIREYFESSDGSEVARRLTELDEPGLLHIFVKHAVTLALDRKSRERELVSGLLVTLCPKVLSQDQVSMGFTRLLGAADDLVLDCPEAVHLLSLFLGRAVVDEVLPPSSLAQMLPALRAESVGVGIIKSVASMLSARHAAERLSNCWNGGMQTLDQIREQIRAALREHVAARDTTETTRLLSELGVPYYHHEVVKEALELVFSSADEAKDRDALVALLGHLSSSGVINQTQMTKGFTRVRSQLDEEALDYGPKAKELFAAIVAQGSKEGWLVLDVEA